MLSMLIMYLRWVFVYEPQVEKITDEFARLYFYLTYKPFVEDYMIALLRELSFVGIYLGIVTLAILAIDVFVFGDEDEEIEETEEIYCKE